MNYYFFICVLLFIVGTIIIYYFGKLNFNKNTHNYEGCQCSSINGEFCRYCTINDQNCARKQEERQQQQQQQQLQQQLQYQQQRKQINEQYQQQQQQYQKFQPLVNTRGLSSTQPLKLNETQMAEIRLKERIKLYSLMVRREIPGDGNCQIHSLSDQIYGDLCHSRLIRSNIAQWLRNNKDFKLPNGATLSNFVSEASWEDYCSNMSKNGTWGDHLTLVAAAELYKTNITIISSVASQNSFFIEIKPRIKSDRNIILSHFSEFHYGSLSQMCRIPRDVAKQNHWSISYHFISLNVPTFLPNYTINNKSFSISSIKSLELLLKYRSKSNNNTTTKAPETTTFSLKNSNSNYNLNSISEYSNLNNNSTSLARSSSCSCNSNDSNMSSGSSGCNNKKKELKSPPNYILLHLKTLNIGNIQETLDKFHSNRADHPKITLNNKEMSQVFKY
ncbi:hypothetical protein DICPUDRAFT_159545 [Dictyostelium purpureum]|uniref:OTU domain-containing protein n=1 Tax=Dictyostelium purpureum TaxID=5786 RepID=F1A4E0_DICPU|nr:uncharacterized protein DICPUDRAFT_159545 [Dictyostelium purpureum]EGC28943.1 hypothetical protein DICPUDRAFT_159545 [Dictyostelium purpureum]|eukprot:XP_003294534.1 hypothetical protein DICPUDRAFT_159545 [Dictyostelium purpureum]